MPPLSPIARGTGLSLAVLAELVAELGPRWQACQDARLADRPHQGAVGGGARHRMFVDRLLATPVLRRHGVTHDVLACWSGVSRSVPLDDHPGGWRGASAAGRARMQRRGRGSAAHPGRCGRPLGPHVKPSGDQHMAWTVRQPVADAGGMPWT